MQVTKTVEETRKQIKQWKKEGKTIGLVPTMGFLHEGHASLIRKCREQNDIVVVSDFVNDLSDQLLQILRDLQEDQSSFQKMGISFEEKAFYDILVKVRDDHGFPYADEKCVVLAKKIKELVDDKAQFADWSTRDDIKNQLNMELTVLLYQNGYPPEWDEEVFEKVMEQAENFKKYAD